MTLWSEVPFESIYLEPSKNGINRPRNTRGSGHKMINMGELFAYGRINNPEMDLVSLNEDEKQKYGVKEGDLLFARQSLVKEGAGKCSIVLSAPETTCFEGHLIRVRLDKNKAVPLFYYYYFSSHEGNGKVQSLVMQVAAAGIRGSELAKLHIPHPPISIQRRIADILSAYDDLIENNTRRIRILEQMARAIYQEWFGRVDKESLPKGWKIATIEDYGDVITGKTPSKAVDTYWNSRDVPFIRTPDMHNQFYCVETTDYVSTEGAYSQKNAFIPPNSLCVSCIGTVGILTITPTRAQTNQQINSVVLNDISDLEFLYFELLGLKETFQSYAAAGATMANLSKGKFMAVNVQCPPKELREKFHAVASPMFEQIKNLQYKNANLRQMRDLLLPRLVSGEIDVSSLS